MHESQRAEVELLARTLLRRNYSLDVQRMNAAFANNGQLSAGLDPDLPPVLFTGDPFRLKPGTCIALLGINPRRQPDAKKAGPGTMEYPALKQSVSEIQTNVPDGLLNYFNHRAQFFEPENAMYYPKYFDPLGKMLRDHWFPMATNARDVFRTHVFKADILPWFSRDIKNLNIAKLLSSEDEAWQLYHQFLSKLLSALKPRWIQCNGKLTGRLMAKTMKVELEALPIQVANKTNETVEVGWFNDSSEPIPVLVHKFWNYLYAKPDDYGNEVADAWKTWLGKEQSWRVKF